MTIAPPPMRRSHVWIAAAVAAGATMAMLNAAPVAAAESCLDQVRDLASQQGTPSKPPTASAKGSADVTTQDLARSGGVIAPPPMDDKSVIKPPSTGVSRMPTIPDVAPQTQNQQDTPAADRTGLQAALTAARAQAERGDEKGCQEALARARTLAERKAQQ
ncbi:MAG: hypothetical protein KIS73_18215 [Enhydrobacter sp.]|nr:hypothetical protein [Enhydrobacter sp.]